MKTIAGSALVLCATVCMAASTAAQTPVGALAIDEREGDQYGWAVDYETAGSAQQRALSECGSGCSVVLTFERCAAYAADQEAGSSAIGWAESYGSSAEARQRALSECGSRGGSGCTVRVWGCNGPVVEDGLGLDRAARRHVQEGLQAAGFDPGEADGMFGPRTRAAIRSWQASQGVRTTGYLDGASAVALRPAVATRTRERPGAGASGGYGGGSGGAAAGAGWRGARGRCGAPVERGSRDIRFLGYLERYRDSGRIVVDGRGYPWRPGSEQPLSDPTMRRRARSDLGIRDPARVLGAHNLRVVKVRVRRQGGARADIGRGTPVHVV